MNSRQTNCQLEQMWGSTKISSQICLFAYFLCPPPACHRDGQFDSHETCAPASAQPCGCIVCSATHIISQLSLDSIFSCHSNHKSLICTGRGWPPICAVSRKQTIHDRPMILVYSIYVFAHQYFTAATACNSAASAAIVIGHCHAMAMHFLVLLDFKKTPIKILFPT